MLVAFLIAVRDAFIAIALAWVGVTLENREAQQPNTCATQTCTDNAR